MNVERLSKCLKEIQEKDAEVLGIKFFAGKVFIDCLLPVSPERDESHKLLSTYVFAVEKE